MTILKTTKYGNRYPEGQWKFITTLIGMTVVVHKILGRETELVSTMVKVLTSNFPMITHILLKAIHIYTKRLAFAVSKDQIIKLVPLKVL